MKTLIERIKNDDLAAVEELYQAVKSTGMKVAVSYVGREGLEEDMFHEAFIKAIENLDKFDEERSFQSWFDVILANTCKSHLRKKQAKPLTQQENEEGLEPTFEEISTIGNPEECWEQAEVRQIIKDLLDSLSDEQKEAIILYYYQSLPIAQIATYQNCGEDTVKSRLFQGRNKLKKSIEEYEKKSNIKLHSIGIGTALFIFFKEDMGNAYACEYLGKAGAAQTAATVAGEVTKKTAAIAVKEAGKTVAMKLSTKILIGVLSTVLVGGGIAAGIALTGDKTPTNNVQSEQVSESTEESEEIVESSVVESTEESAESSVVESTVESSVEENAEESVEISTEEVIETSSEETEQSEETENVNSRFKISVDENGIKRITTNTQDVQFLAANGGVIITYSAEGKCGAIDYDGNELVPNKYSYYYDGGPDNDGNFILGEDDMVAVFDKQGNKVYEVYNHIAVSISEGFVTYTQYDGGLGMGTVGCYDIANDKLHTNHVYGPMSYLLALDVVDGKYLFSYSNFDAEDGIYYGTTDGSLEPVNMDGDYCICMWGSHNNGYAYGQFNEMEGIHHLFNEDFSEDICFEFHGDYYDAMPVEYYANGVTYSNRGAQLVLASDGMSPGEQRYYLLDLKGYHKNDAIESYILADYAYISLSECGIYYAEEADENFFLNTDGSRIEDVYVDHSVFAGDYATVLDENGLAYLINKDFEVLTQGYEAESVTRLGEQVSYKNGTEQTLFIVEEY